MSKLSQLKQNAYQAGKKRDWVQAVSIYEQILELDKNNPTLINELGDLCLKAGKTPNGVKHFLTAAAKYRNTGLLNNAVAIYKKILRYDSDNMNAHWFLAESRASQGLLMEGSQHALIFLGNKDGLSGEIKEIFLKRCTQLFELYPDNTEILENLLQVFRMWNLGQEAGRTTIQLACLKWDAGQNEPAEQMVQETLAQIPELANYPEYARWMEKQGIKTQPASNGDFDAVTLGEPVSDEMPVEATPPELLAESEKADSPLDSTSKPEKNEADFGDVSIGDSATVDQSEKPAVDEPDPSQIVDPFASSEPDLAEEEKPQPSGDNQDDGGCFNLDIDEGCSFDDLIAQATAGIPKVGSGEDDSEAPSSDSKTVNLLDELLAEDTDGSFKKAVHQEETISDEIGAQLGGDNSNDDPASLYEMGMVYLEMGMNDKACASFQKATCHAEYAVRAFEMWGIALMRGDKIDDAVAVLTEGLDIPEEGSREYLGLLYHIARAHEQGANTDEALRIFEMIHLQDPGFLDVGRRVAKLATVS